MRAWRGFGVSGASVIILSVACLTARAEVLEVPSAYPTITAAIEAAYDGDVVRVAPGTYVENIDFMGKAIVVTSHYFCGGDWGVVERTIIDGSSPADPYAASTVTFQSGEGPDSVLHGFTITGGAGTVWVDPQFPTYSWRGGGGIFIFQSSPMIVVNWVTGNVVENPGDVDGAQAGGILTYGGDPVIQTNLITGNQAGYGGGLVVDYSGATVRNTIIAANSAGVPYGGGGVWTIGTGSEPILFENTTVADNTSDSWGGAFYVWSSVVEVRNSIIWGNSQAQGGPIRVVSGGLADIEYSDVEGGFAGAGNADVDPQFLNTVNYLLDPGSDCVDAGDPDPAYNDREDPAQPGQAKWPSEGGLRNDMGAYGGPSGAAVLLGVDLGLIFADDFEAGDTSAW